MTLIEERRKVMRAVNGITLTMIWDEVSSSYLPDDSIEIVKYFDIENIRFEMAGGNHGVYILHEEELNDRVLTHWDGYLENNGYKKLVTISWIKEDKVYA